MCTRRARSCHSDAISVSVCSPEAYVCTGIERFLHDQLCSAGTASVLSFWSPSHEASAIQKLIEKRERTLFVFQSTTI